MLPEGFTVYDLTLSLTSAWRAARGAFIPEVDPVITKLSNSFTLSIKILPDHWEDIELALKTISHTTLCGCLETDNVSSRLKYALFLDTTVHVIFPCILVHTQCVAKYKISSFFYLKFTKNKKTPICVYIVASFMLFTKRRGGGTGKK